MPKSYKICGWVNPRMPNHRYEGSGELEEPWICRADSKPSADFWLTPALYKGQLDTESAFFHSTQWFWDSATWEHASELHSSSWLSKGFPGSSVVKNLPVNAGGVGSIPGSGRSTGGENGYPLQYACLENSMDRGAWQATVGGVAESDTTEQGTHRIIY